MTSRRAFLAGAIGLSLAARASWAELGAPAFLTAGQDSSDENWLCGLSEVGDVLFQTRIPNRGHAAAAHPSQTIAVGFARRPGVFAFVLNCLTGEIIQELTAPVGRHFYGHGVFSQDGTRLYTTENDFDGARGVIGVWAVDKGFQRVAEFSSHGIGPHELCLLPEDQGLVIANGGIETHPDSGRAKLNLPFMMPNLAYVSLTGELLESVEPSANLRLHSLRHLDVRADGLVAVAMQWQGAQTVRVPVLALHRRGQPFRFLGAQPHLSGRMAGYGGSVAFSRDGARVAISSPRGGRVQVFDSETESYLYEAKFEDVCGLSSAASGFVATTGTGALIAVSSPADRVLQRTRFQWDNHLVALTR